MSWTGFSSVHVKLGLAIGAALLSASPALAAIEEIEIPPSRQQGVDMILVDEDAMPDEPELARHRAASESWNGTPAPVSGPVNPLYSDLANLLGTYRERWGGLPQLLIGNAGAPIAAAADPRLGTLRQRLGLAKTGGFDKALQGKLADYQKAHGLKADGKAGTETLASLNRGAAYYERLIGLNMERARRLPSSDFAGKYLVVDAGSARLTFYEGGRAVDSMKVIVGAPETETPMLAALMRFSSVNPYWNVPPELVKKLIAKNVLAQGMTYLSDRRYQVFDSWNEDAAPIDPTSVDWHAVADGKLEVRVRQMPGGANSMGGIKFMMPNEYGIYLHDTPNKALFNESERWISNGCIRVEDAGRLARWLYGDMPAGADPDREERVDLAQPVPVYVTYLTVGADAKGLTFRPDRYKRDAVLMARFAGESGMIDPDAEFKKAMSLEG